MSLKGKSLCVLVPMHDGKCTHNYHLSVTKLILACQKNNVAMTELVSPGGAILSMVRNELTNHFMHRTRATHALLVDSDIGFEPDDVLRMLDSDHEVIGAPCTRKNIRWDRVVKAVKKANGKELTVAEMKIAAGDPVAVYENPADVDVYEPQPMNFLGTGLLMVKRDAFELLESAYPERWYYSRSSILSIDTDGAPAVRRVHEFFTLKIDKRTRIFLQEDYAFCKECRSCGIIPVMFPWVRTTHYGGHLFVGDLAGMAALTGEL